MIDSSYVGRTLDTVNATLIRDHDQFSSAAVTEVLKLQENTGIQETTTMY